MSSPAVSRREFLRVGAATAAAAALPLDLHADNADPFGGFTMAIQSYTFRNFKLEPALKKIADLGIKYAEFFRNHIPTDSTPEQLTAIKNLCKEMKVAPVSFGVEGFGKDHDANKKKFEFAKALEIKFLSADPDGSEECWTSLDKLCEEYKIAIAIHPHGPTGKKKENRHRWWSAEVIMQAVKDHHELIGTCLDTGHLIRMAQHGEKLDPAQQVRVMGARNFGMHLKDHNNEKFRDVVYGKDGGVLDVPGVLKALREVKFKGYIAIEYEHNPADPSADVAACIEVFKESVKKLG